jgi:hypothetical protein
MPGLTARRVAWAGVLVLAAVLRFTGLEAGLRHAPHMDEQSFVMNTAGMRAAGNLDHRYYLYPGLPFYLLAPVLAPYDPLSPSAYLALRRFQAVFSVASVALAGVLATRLGGPVAGLAAGALLAVSPLEVRTVHLFRPDVVLQAFVLAALLALRRVGDDLKGDLLAGAAVGAATAIKFSGVLVAIGYTVHRLVARPIRWAYLPLAGLASLAAFAVLSPYTFLAGSKALARAQTQVAYHYVDKGQATAGGGYLERLGTYLATLPDGLGWPAVLLAVAGMVAARARWRSWAPHAATVAGALAVFASAEVTHDRFVVPYLGVVCAGAGLGVAALADRDRRLAGVVAAVAVAVPLVASVRYAAAVSRPGARDRVADWVGAHVPAGGRVVTTDDWLRFPGRALEVVETSPLDARTIHLAAGAEVIVTREGDTFPDLLPVVATFEPAWTHPDARLHVRRRSAAFDARYRPLALRPGQVTTTSGPGAALVDGDLATLWTTGRGQRPGDAIEIALDEAAPVVRIELQLGDRPRHFAQGLNVLAGGDGGAWQRVASWPGRPALDEQQGARSQVLVMEPKPVRRLRLEQTGRRERPWSVAELSLTLYAP